MYRPSANAILWAIVVLIVVMVAFVSGIVITGNVNSESTPLITTVLGGGATTVAALVALLKADVAAQKTDDLHAQVQNGMQQVAIMATEKATDPLDKPEHVDRLQALIRDVLKEHDTTDHTGEKV